MQSSRCITVLGNLMEMLTLEMHSFMSCINQINLSSKSEHIRKTILNNEMITGFGLFVESVVEGFFTDGLLGWDEFLEVTVTLEFRADPWRLTGTGTALDNLEILPLEVLL